jgi:hypothetical protein
MPSRLPDADGACVAGCCIPAKAGSVVAAAEAAPRIRINDLRETPCVIVEFIKVLLDKIWFVEMQRRGDRWRIANCGSEDSLMLSAKTTSPCSYSFFWELCE